MNPINGKLTEGYTIVRSPARQLYSLDTRLLASIFAASAAFIVKEGKSIWSRERKKTRLGTLLSKVTGIEAHNGGRNTFMDCRVCVFWGRVQQIHGQNKPPIGALSVFKFHFWLLKKNGPPQQVFVLKRKH